MALWLFKEEPGHYSFGDLQQERRTVWEGVSNSLARKHLRQVRPGDRVFFYHTGKEKAIVGEMRVISAAHAAADADEETPERVEVEAVRALARPVALARIKKDPQLASWDLVRLPRLSVLPVSEAQWRRVEDLSRKGEG
jgi:predicted RNA-binding protein with PUA-like domain